MYDDISVEQRAHDLSVAATLLIICSKIISKKGLCKTT